MKYRVKLENDWELSIIDDGYGKENGLYEIGLWRNKTGDSCETTRIEGWLSLQDVFDYIKKCSDDSLEVYCKLSH